MADPFARMHDRLFAHLSTEATTGDAATLDGAAVQVSIEHGVAITGDMGEVVAYRDVAVIRGATPKIGATLIVGGKSYTIDNILDNTGYSARCILRA